MKQNLGINNTNSGNEESRNIISIRRTDQYMNRVIRNN
jgi:hypothetical protein